VELDDGRRAGGLPSRRRSARRQQEPRLYARALAWLGLSFDPLPSLSPFPSLFISIASSVSFSGLYARVSAGLRLSFRLRLRIHGYGFRSLDES
jgi:hypothetical protein